MKTLLVSYRWFIAYGAIWSAVITGVAVHDDGGLGSAAPRPTETVLATVTETMVITIGPRTEAPTAFPLPSAAPPSTPTPTPTATPSPSPTVTPTETPSPRNRAHGLRNGCLVEKKKWLILQPCKMAERLVAVIQMLGSVAGDREDAESSGGQP